MALPTQEQLMELNEEINRILRGQDKNVGGNWYNFVSVRNALEATNSMGKSNTGGIKELLASKSLTTGATRAAQTMGVVVPGPLGHIFPFGAVLSPWITAASIIIKSNGLYSLYDIKEAINKGAPNSYKCKCGRCGDNIQYIIDKKERKFGVAAVSAFTAGIPSLGQAANSIRKSFQSGRPKERITKEFLKAARTENGCTAAMATIFNLSGGSFFTKRSDVETLNTAIAIIVSNDWKELKSRW